MTKFLPIWPPYLQLKVFFGVGLILLVEIKPAVVAVVLYTGFQKTRASML
jgi:hypothetical protein